MGRVEIADAYLCTMIDSATDVNEACGEWLGLLELVCHNPPCQGEDKSLSYMG